MPFAIQGENIRGAPWNWDSAAHCVVYLGFVCLSVFYLESVMFGHLMIGHDNPSPKKMPPLPLRFDDRGHFKILQVADMHFANGAVTRCMDVLPNEFRHCTDLNTSRFLLRAIHEERPDLIVFTGDNIYGPDAADAADSMDGAFASVVKARIPWAAVLGNHDQESTMSRQELMSYLAVMDYSLSQINPLYREDGDEAFLKRIDGFGNYNLEIKGPAATHLHNTSVFNLYFLDSGDKSTVAGVRGYGWIKESQQAWLRDVSTNLQDAYRMGSLSVKDDVAPAVAFFHIPLPEVKYVGGAEIVGEMQEAVGCANVNSGVLSTFVSMGDVKAAFTGHDHVNDFCGMFEGIWLCYGGGFGYHAYGKAGWSRRTRLIHFSLAKGDHEHSWQGVDNITTWKRLDDTSFTRIDDQTLWKRS